MQVLQGPLIAVLCFSLVCQNLPGEQPGGITKNLESQKGSQSPAGSTQHTTHLQADARVLHALNRFTFGPRSGDVESRESDGAGEMVLTSATASRIQLTQQT